MKIINLYREETIILREREKKKERPELKDKQKVYKAECVLKKTIYHALTGLLLRWVKCPILAITSCLAEKAGSPAVESQNKKKQIINNT